MGIHFKAFPLNILFWSSYVLIATLDSVILLLFVKWAISEVLLPLKYDLVLQDTVPVNNCVSKQYWYFSKLFTSFMHQTWSFCFHSFEYILLPPLWDHHLWGMAMSFTKAKLANYTNWKWPHQMAMRSSIEVPVKKITSMQICSNSLSVKLELSLVKLTIKTPLGYWTIQFH